MTLSDAEVIEYLLHVLNNEYKLSINTDANKATEKFLTDIRFSKFHEAIFKMLIMVLITTQKEKS